MSSLVYCMEFSIHTAGRLLGFHMHTFFKIMQCLPYSALICTCSFCFPLFSCTCDKQSPDSEPK